jgi:hypothetical protein
MHIAIRPLTAVVKASRPPGSVEEMAKLVQLAEDGDLLPCTAKTLQNLWMTTFAPGQTHKSWHGVTARMSNLITKRGVGLPPVHDL